ncbi:MAG: sugar ABC transporter permease [Clostridia bacterium]|nr:sugar ABC transporter permease [Clostridia bacterium]
MLRVHKAVPYLMISAACLLLLVFRVIPLFYSLLGSVYIDGVFTLDTFEKLFFHDTIFWRSMWITVKLNIVVIPLQIVVSLLLALLVNQDLKGIGAFRTTFMTPFAISGVVNCLIWGLLLAKNNGVINSLLNAFGLPSQGFWSDKNQALWCIVAESTWAGSGYWMIFFLSGLKGIDTTIYESAALDGCGPIRRLWSITLPLMRRTILFVMVANTTANLLLFTPMKTITNGGPMGSTNALMYEAYKSSFQFNKPARSSAIVSVLLVMIGLVCALQFFLLRDKDETKAKKGGAAA